MQHGKRTVWIVTLCVMAALCGRATGDAVQVHILATAEERGGTEPDVFGVGFGCDNDIRIQQIIFDLSYANAPLHFDVAPHDNGGYDFTILPDAYYPTIVSDNVGVWSYWSQDDSPLLIMNFNDFQPGEILYFAIDVDGDNGNVFTAEQFAGARLGIVLNLEPAFPGADPVGIYMTFVNENGLVIAEFTSPSNEIPEPATWTLLVGGSVLLVRAARRRGRRSA